MICTQVVASIPPNTTYTIISTPTADDRRLIGDARVLEQQRHERARADHLRDHVERADGQRASAAIARTGRGLKRYASTSAIVYLPALRSGSATISSTVR